VSEVVLVHGVFGARIRNIKTQKEIWPGSSRDVFPLAYSLFLCETHAELTGNISFQDNLLNILLLQKTTADRVGKVTLE